MSFPFIGTAFAESAYTLDSLLRVVSKNADSENVMRALKTLSVINREKPDEVFFLNRLLREAERVDSVAVIYDALSNLSRYYYNLSNSDSLAYWVRYTDSIVNLRKDNPDTYYDVHSFISKDFLYKDLYDLSIDEAVKLQKKAQETGHVYGMICSSETLGIIYQASQQDSLAIEAFQDALTRLEAIDGDLYYRTYIMSYQIRSCLKQNKLEDVQMLLEKYKKTLDLRDEINRKNHIVYTMNWHRWMQYSFYVDLYLQKNQITKAKQALDQSTAYAVSGNGLNNNTDFSAYYYNCVKARYYKRVKNYPEALAAIDTILNNSLEPEILDLKIELLTEKGDYEEAVVLYKKRLQLTEKKYNTAFTNQVKQLRTVYNVNDREVQAKELEISNLEVQAKKRQLFYSLVLSGTLLLLLYIIFLIYRRTRKLKNELVEEKVSLIDSKQKLNLEKKKAELANQKKTRFIASMSHEIRTPLNAIVGFSSLLIDPICKNEDKNEFLSIIDKNSDILLNLINDVLDLSRIEAGNLKFSFEPTDLVVCCEEILCSVKHKVSSEVALTLTVDRDSFILYTDPQRLRQLLLNLLNNALKFTSKGEINLAFEVNEDKREVKFIITDTGCGIPLSEQDKIFERFEKLDEYAQGTGLGLSICRIIAERLGGCVSIDPYYIGGARFLFVHPLDRAVAK